MLGWLTAGAVHGPAEVRKLQGYRLDAFSSGEAGPLAWMEEGQLRPLRDWPSGTGWTRLRRRLQPPGSSAAIFTVSILDRPGPTFPPQAPRSKARLFSLPPWLRPEAD